MLSVWRWTSGCSSGEKVDDDDVCARKSKLGGSTESSWPSAHIGRAGHMRRRLYELLIESYSLYGMQRRIARRAVLQEGMAFRNRASKYNTGSGKVYRSLSQTEGLAVRISACGLERLASGCVRSARLYDKDLKCAADGRGGRAKVVCAVSGEVQQCYTTTLHPSPDTVCYTVTATLLIISPPPRHILDFASVYSRTSHISAPAPLASARSLDFKSSAGIPWELADVVISNCCCMCPPDCWARFRGPTPRHHTRHPLRDQT